MTGLIIGIVLLIIALIPVLSPFMNQRRSNNRSELLEQKKRDELLTSYERVLATIRDLDEDHQTGKIAPETYQREREYWTEQGILLLQKLETDTDVDLPSPKKVEEFSDSEADVLLDDAIEKAISKYREMQA